MSISCLYLQSVTYNDLYQTSIMQTPIYLPNYRRKQQLKTTFWDGGLRSTGKQQWRLYFAWTSTFTDTSGKRSVLMHTPNMPARVTELTNIFEYAAYAWFKVPHLNVTVNKCPNLFNIVHQLECPGKMKSSPLVCTERQSHYQIH